MKYSRQELCRRYKNERNKLYKRRAKIESQQQAGWATDKKWEALEKQKKNISARIDDMRVKIFKCGKKFEKLRTDRSKLVKKRWRVAQQVKSLEPGSDKNKLYKKLYDLNSTIRDMSDLMGKKIIVEKGKIEVIRDSEYNVFSQNITLWDLNDEVTPLIDSGRFDFIYIDGEEYAIENNRPTVLFALDDYIERRNLSQKDSRTKTPMVWVIVNQESKTISIQEQR